MCSSTLQTGSRSCVLAYSPGLQASFYTDFTLAMHAYSSPMLNTPADWTVGISRTSTYARYRITQSVPVYAIRG